MEHKGTVKLETERLILRRHEITDAVYYSILKDEYERD